MKNIKYESQISLSFYFVNTFKINYIILYKHVCKILISSLYKSSIYNFRYVYVSKITTTTNKMLFKASKYKLVSKNT